MIGRTVTRLHRSLPSRERGLKLLFIALYDKGHRSLLSRERGLKFLVGVQVSGEHRSLPSRERGLKFGGLGPGHGPADVAPFTGAWIEMY